MYKITRHTSPKFSEIATAKGYSRIEDAFADMQDGVVWRDGEIVAFHERHLAWLERTTAAA